LAGEIYAQAGKYDEALECFSKLAGELEKKKLYGPAANAYRRMALIDHSYLSRAFELYDRQLSEKLPEEQRAAWAGEAMAAVALAEDEKALKKTGLYNKLEKYAQKAEEAEEKDELGERRGKESRLAQKIAAAVAAVGMICGVGFLANNFTGNAVANATNITSNWTGAVLIIIGLIGASFYFFSKK
jgi:tetratricopeptide (TPR) repeat protein